MFERGERSLERRRRAAKGAHDGSTRSRVAVARAPAGGLARDFELQTRTFTAQLLGSSVRTRPKFRVAGPCAKVRTLLVCRASHFRTHRRRAVVFEGVVLKSRFESRTALASVLSARAPSFPRSAFADSASATHRVVRVRASRSTGQDSVRRKWSRSRARFADAATRASSCDFPIHRRVPRSKEWSSPAWPTRCARTPDRNGIRRRFAGVARRTLEVRPFHPTSPRGSRL